LFGKPVGKRPFERPRYGWKDDITISVGEIAGFLKKLEHVCDQFPKYQMKILLGDFNAT
jgi:hypothetical protein